ncbi:TetR/AcrR family transcriptional regulator [Mycolicibacterium elephantis]|uniref:TetR family transcriptional regulator n=1 Tax=Mycolicibacterium elephantis DSM 44368 TaxID=1335622 RepID=A0A439DMX9_9MYCO|nr:TetR/AcrR family transcriptional regulator [Mycolicibacterium elephantis]MCV7220292.1 TetR/AcrR family transcriptional regulator [Mycolicibacterium elephantis]RWA16426.1 TetR family transcriptional regulator [Mycolicibacterium elephantis DSM 44368]
MAQPVRHHARSSVRKLQLSQAAARLFSERGYHNVSMDDVASAVGLTGPALYRHFRKKHDILAQAISEQLGAVHAVAEKAVAADLAPAERRAQFLSELGELVLEREEMMLWKRERRQLSESEQDAFRDKFNELLRLTIEALGLAENGESKADAELRAWSVLGIYSSIAPARKRMEPAAAKRVMQTMAENVLACELNGTALAAAPPEPAPRRPPGRRERILSTATRLFYAQSYHAVGIEEIAAAADTAIATFYQYFNGKAELLQAVLNRGAEGLHYVTNHRLPAATTPQEAVDVIACTLIELALGPHQPILAILAADLIYLPEEAQEAIRTSEREYVDEWVAAINGIRPDISTHHARLLAQSAIGLVTDLTQTASVRSRPGIAAELHHLVTAVLAA